MSLFLIGILTFLVLVKDGLGHAGYQPPVFWSVYITTFVFWVGIGHAGTLISAILFLFRSPWRTAVYRSTEAMTVFAVMTAGLFPIIHIGRQWIFYWLLPYPERALPLAQLQVAADLGRLRDLHLPHGLDHVPGLRPDPRRRGGARQGDAAGGRRSTSSPRWAGRAPTTSGGTTRGRTCTWPRWPRRWCSRCTRWCPGTSPCRIVPGWHGTIFAPYFVAGAIYSGIGMVLTLIIPLRRALKLEHMITDYHFDNLAKLTLLTGSILFYAYGMEYFVAWYSGNIFEQTTFYRRAFGPYWWAGWTMIICNAFVSQLLWFRKIRTNLTSLFVISIFINIGMWFERFVIIVSSLSNDYIPWAWDQLNPTWADWGILAGSFGWFGMWFLLFAKNFPIVAIQEIKEMIPMPRKRGGHH